MAMTIKSTIRPRASRHRLCVSTPAHNCHTWHISKWCSHPPWPPPPPTAFLISSSLSPGFFLSLSVTWVLTHPSPLHPYMTSECLFTDFFHSPGSKIQQDADTFFERKDRYSSSPKLRKPNTLYSADGTSVTLQTCYPNSHYLTDSHSPNLLSKFSLPNRFK